MILVSIGVIAEIFGVCTQTIRNWCDEGMFEVYLTAGGHRRFDLEQIDGRTQEDEKSTIVYSRVSSYDQKDDLKRQTEELEQYCNEQGIENYEVIKDIGSGINYKKTGLRRLIRQVLSGKTKRIIVSYQDRLLRFGNELLFELCRMMNVDVVVLNEEENPSFEEKLARDVLTILIVYSSKIYGKRSHEKRKKEKTKKEKKAG